MTYVSQDSNLTTAVNSPGITHCLPTHGDIIHDVLSDAITRYFVVPDTPDTPIESGPVIEWINDPISKPSFQTIDALEYALKHEQARIVNSGVTFNEDISQNVSIQKALRESGLQYLQTTYRDITYDDYDTITGFLHEPIPSKALSSNPAVQYQFYQLSPTIKNLIEQGVTQSKFSEFSNPIKSACASVHTSAPCDPFIVTVSPGSRNIRDYTVSSWSGEGLLQKLNGFLARPEVNYAHRFQHSGFKRALIVESHGDTVGVAAVGHPNAQKLNHRKDIMVLHRLATHEDAPQNLVSYLISRTYRWAYLSGYDVYRTHAGVANNTGTVYQASNLTQTLSKDIRANQRSNRENRQSHSSYTRNRYDGFLSIHPFDGRRPHALREPFDSTPRDGYLNSHGFPTNPHEYLLTHDYPISHTKNSIEKFFTENNETIPTNETIIAVFTARGIDPIVYDTVTMVDDINPIKKRTPLDRSVVTSAYPALTIIVTDKAGDRRNPSRTASISGVCLDDAVPYPENLARWLITNVGEWCSYTGYDNIQYDQIHGCKPVTDAILSMQPEDQRTTNELAVEQFEGSCNVNLQENTKKALNSGGTQQTLEIFQG